MRHGGLWASASLRAVLLTLGLAGANSSHAGNGVEVHCLALNIYHEARGENYAGRLAVARVTLNRVRSDVFPDSICEVVWQPRQFSWTHDQYPDKPENPNAWEDALEVARNALETHHESTSLGNVTYFHADNVWPHWAEEQVLVAVIGSHLFYE